MLARLGGGEDEIVGFKNIKYYQLETYSPLRDSP